MTQTFHCFIQARGMGPGEQVQPAYQSLGTRDALLCSSEVKISGASALHTCGEKERPSTRTMESQSSGRINQTDHYSVDQGTESITWTRRLQCEYMQVSSRLALGLRDGK